MLSGFSNDPYYGLAVRENLDDVNKMATAIKAVANHVALTDSETHHHLCLDGNDSWRGYKRDSKSDKRKNSFSKSIVEVIEPVFNDRSNPNLLEKCTHGLTQNVNECLNGLIWDRSPKTTYVEYETVSLATNLVVLKFRDGDISYLKIFDDLNIKPGMSTSQGLQKCEPGKARRKTFRHLRKKYIDDVEEKKGVVHMMLEASEVLIRCFDSKETFLNGFSPFSNLNGVDNLCDTVNL